MPSDGDALRRIDEFRLRIQEKSCTRKARFRWGTALFHDRLPRVWDLNFLRVEGAPQDLVARALVAESDRLQGAAGLEHRMVGIEDNTTGARISPELRALGWSAECVVIMVHRRPPYRDADTTIVREIDEDTAGAATEAFTRTQPYGRHDDTVGQIIEMRRVIARAVPTRHFGAPENGAPVSFCDLYSRDGIGQIEDVATLEAYRGRGLATAVVAKALEESIAAGNDITFLTADDDDWPKDLYNKLGFDPLGYKHSALKHPPGSGDDAAHSALGGGGSR
ncbi:MAG: GNAT family N-acetyltransferase [Actinomycetota bacterium]|nr:GNAT family N-acetyltransferase [Actinomycetota bacterium]